MTGSFLIRIFRASNFLEFMWPSFALSQGFGLFPYQISSGIISASILGYVYAASVLTLLTLTIFALSYRINFSDGMNYETLPALIQSNCYLLLGYSFCLSSFTRSEKKLELFKKLSQISFHVPKIKWNKAALFIHGKDIVGFLFLIGQMPNTLKGSPLDVFIKIICSHLTLVVYLLDNQFLNCVLAIKLSFENINTELKILEEKIKVKELNSLIGRFTEDGETYMGKNLFAEIRSLRKKYEDICTVVKCTNDAFSMPIIISLGLTFVEVTFSLYFYFLKSIGAKEINLEKQIWHFYFITSAAYYSTKLLAAVWACETTDNEAQKCKIIVHRILTQLYDKEITEELQLFSLQMIQRKISFAAHGISLDGSLVTGVARGISTYILILIQFLITDKQCLDINESLN